MIRFFPRTLRLRVTLLFTLVFGIVAGSAIAISYLHLQNELYSRIDHDLISTARRIHEIVIQEGEAAPNWNQLSQQFRFENESKNLTYIVQIIRHTNDSMVVNSRTGFPSFTKYPVPESRKPFNLMIDGHHYRVFRHHHEEFVAFVASPSDLVVYALEQMQTAYMIYLPLAIFIASLLVYIIVQVSLQPITNAARTADRITSQNLNERLPQPKLADEVGELVITLNKMIERIEGAFKQVKQFTADAAHELHTPLTILRGEIEVALRKNIYDEQSVKLLKSNLDEVNRLINIVESLFTLTHIDSNQVTVEFSPVELHNLLDELFEKAKVIAEPKKITVTVMRNDPVIVEGDTYRLIQLFLNLINNAVRYTPEHGSLTLASELKGHHVHVCVCDTGIGIPPSEIDKIFDRFYRVDKARSREMGGSGLGLSIVKWIVEMHKGTITVQSTEEKGSTFEVILPVVTGNQA